MDMTMEKKQAYIPIHGKGRKERPLSPVERYWQSEWRLYDELNLACFKQ